MSRPCHSLFNPVTVGDLVLPNRVCMEPMKVPGVRPDGTPSPEVVEYYRVRAGAGLVVSQAFWVCRQGRGYEHSPGMATARHRNTWRSVVDAVHGGGGRIFAQLTHSGRLTHAGLTGFSPVAPSAVAVGGTGFAIRTGMRTAPVPEELSRAQIADIVDAFERGTEYALEAGFDGVELHGCNGYLVSQFLSTNANLRTDAYGGHHENRARFALEVLEAMVRVAGARRVGLKLSPLKFSLYDVEEGDASRLNPHLAGACEALGISYLNIQRPAPDSAEGRSAFNVLDLFRPRYKGVLIACGGFSNRSEAEHCLEDCSADLIGFGRAFQEHADHMERLVRDEWDHGLLIDPDPTVIVRTHKPKLPQGSKVAHPANWMQKPWTRT